MLHGRRLAAFLFLAVAAVPFLGLELFGQDKEKKGGKDKESKDPSKVTLAWKFKKGESFFQKMVTTTTQNMTVMNNNVTQRQEQTFWFEWKPLEEKDGEWILSQTIKGVKMDIDIGGSPIKYDSTNAGNTNTSNPLSDFFKALVGAEFKVHLNPKTLKITKIEGRDKFLSSLVAANKQMEPLLKQILSEKALIEMAEPTFAVVPDKEIGKDGTWKKETSLDMGPIGKYKNEYIYTYEGPEKGKSSLEKIKVDTKLTYSPPESTQGVGGLPFKITSADLKSTNASGTILFNKEKGRVEKTDMKLELKGDLEIEIGGQKTKVTLSQDQKTEVTTTDTMPTEIKPPSASSK